MSGQPPEEMMDAFAEENTTESRLGDGKGLEIADPADFGISRDEDEELRPLKQRIPGTDKAVSVKPLNSSQVEKYDEALNRNAADDELVDEMFREHIVEGPGSDGLHDGLPGYIVSGLIQAIKNSSGYDVFLATQEQRQEETQANLRMMNQMDPEMMTRLQEFAEEMDLDMAEITDQSTNSPNAPE